MGLFDLLRCELPLPIGQECLFQTKDTDAQFMDHYTITKAGRLIHHFHETEETPQAERPYPNETGLLGLFGMIRKKAGSERDIDQNFDGDLEFYPDIQHQDVNVTYRATFRNGACVEICKWRDAADTNDGKWEQVYAPENVVGA